LRWAYRARSELRLREHAVLPDGDGSVQRRRSSLRLGVLLHHRLLRSGAPMTKSPIDDRDLKKLLAEALARLFGLR
jgi:hypothetical protein